MRCACRSPNHSGEVLTSIVAETVVASIVELRPNNTIDQLSRRRFHRTPYHPKFAKNRPLDREKTPDFVRCIESGPRQAPRWLSAALFAPLAVL
jgi:hypothetical protein